jgi:hypothetical protein
MKEMKKQVYLTPAVQVKNVAVEDGYAISQISAEAIGDGGTIVNF